MELKILLHMHSFHHSQQLVGVMANGNTFLWQSASAGMAIIANPWRLRSRTKRLKLQALGNERPDFFEPRVPAVPDLLPNVSH